MSSIYHQIKQVDGTHKVKHRIIAEAVLGKPLPSKAVVHHVDENGRNNQNTNLVICQDKEYHQLLHRRKRAYEATGNPNLVRCHHCNTWDTEANMSSWQGKTKPTKLFWHLNCKRIYDRNHYKTRAQRLRLQAAAKWNPDGNTAEL